MNIKKIICLIISIMMILSCSCSVFAVSSGEAYIVSPSDGDWLDTTQKITIRVAKPNSKSTLKITIKNDVTGAFIAQNEEFSGTAYTLNPDVLVEKQRYKVWVGTFENGTAIGQGDVIYINTNDVKYSPADVKYSPAYFTSPSANDTVSADSNLKISWSQNSALAYWLSIKDETTGKKIVDEKELHLGYYVIDKSLLTTGHKYKAWIGTYVSSSIEKNLLGSGDTIYFSTNNEDQTPTPSAAKITYPENMSWLSTQDTLTVKWNSENANLTYGIVIRDDTSEKIIINDTTSSSSYIIKANTFTPQQRYKITLATYYNGQLIDYDIVYFNTMQTSGDGIDFLSPANGDTVSALEDLKVVFKNCDNSYVHKLSIRDVNKGSMILEKQLITGNNYTVEAGTLESNREYKLWVGTYLNNSATDALDDGNIIYIKTESEDVPTGENPSLQEVYDYVLNRIKNREVYKKCPDILRALLAMIYQESGAKQFENGTVKIGDNGSTKDYGICQINSSSILGYNDNGLQRTWDEIKSDWRANLDEGIDRYAERYWILQDEGDNLTYNQVLRNLINEGYTIEEAAARCAYSMYNGGKSTSVAIRWTSSPTSGDKGFWNHYSNRTIEEKLGIINYPPTPDPGIYDDVPTNHKNYDAIISMSQKGILSGYGDGTFRPDAYVTRAEFTKMMNSAGLLDKDGGFKRGIPSFTDTQSHWAVNDINKAYMVGAIDGYDQFSFIPNNNITFQEAAKILSVLVGADEDDIKQKGGWPYGYIWFAYDNDIGANTSFEVSSSTVKSYEYVGNKISRADAAQMVYNAMSLNYVAEKTGKVSFENVLEETASKHFGNTYKSYVSSSDTPWCVYCATKIAQDALKTYGLADKEAKNIVPTEGSTARLINYYSREKYHNFTKYTSLVTGVSYSPNCYSNKDYTPKVGDFVFVETGSKIEITDDNGNKKKVDNPGPDHTELIVSVDEENSTFITIAGNTSTPTVCYKDYEYNTNKKMWTRKGSSTYVHGFISPDYPI